VQKITPCAIKILIMLIKDGGGVQKKKQEEKGIYAYPMKIQANISEITTTH